MPQPESKLRTAVLFLGERTRLSRAWEINPLLGRSQNPCCFLDSAFFPLHSFALVWSLVLRGYPRFCAKGWPLATHGGTILSAKDWATGFGHVWGNILLLSFWPSSVFDIFCLLIQKLNLRCLCIFIEYSSYSLRLRFIYDLYRINHVIVFQGVFWRQKSHLAWCIYQHFLHLQINF